jgi:SAM-dependent methyltransferase
LDEGSETVTAGDKREVSAEDGRRLFGLDPAAYAAGRPGYPAQLFDHLVERCGLGKGTATLEVGPGAGQATAELLARGASPYVAVEADPGMARHLAERFGNEIEIVNAPFEEAELALASIDLAVCATAWHWIDQDQGLAKIAAVVRPDGWWAMWWTMYHDPERPNAFYEALETVLRPARFVGHSENFGADREQRIADITATGAFEHVSVDDWRWTLELDAARARALFGTFSPILALEPRERERILAEIGAVVDEQFGGHVERNCVTVLYTAQRR